MNLISKFAPILLAVTAVSCTPEHAPLTQAPTPAPAYIPPDVNPVYDTPAAYEEASAITAPTIPTTLPESGMPQAIPTPVASSNGAAIIHTVVAGDTLSGISRKYKVPSAAIKAANRMTNDTVVLGKKMAIPPAR
jgi:LysM repeat protein